MSDYARLTVDMTSEEHTYLKMASAQLGISMREFVLLATFKKMEDLEDQWLSERAKEARKRLED
jgi:hypothetical protein